MKPFSSKLLKNGALILRLMSEIRKNNYEEITNIPENVSEGIEIDIDIEEMDIDNYSNDTDYEEITGIKKSASETVHIEDDYNGNIQFGSSGISKNIKEEKNDNLEKNNIIQISDKVKNRLPDDFDVNGIGAIDLREAEAIANENALFFTENDILNELEDLNVLHLEDDDIPKPTVDKENNIDALNIEIPAIDKNIEDISIDSSSEHKIINEKQPDESEISIQFDTPTVTKKEVESKAEETYDIGTSLEKGSEVPPEINEFETENEENESKGNIVDIDVFGDGFIETTVKEKDEDELSYFDDEVPESDEGLIQELSKADSEIKLDDENNENIIIEIDGIIKEDAHFIDFDLDEIESEKFDTFEKIQTKPDIDEEDEQEITESEIIEKEKLPVHLQEISKNRKDVIFIDDEIVDLPDHYKRSVFEENELEKITSKMVEIEEGVGWLLSESDYDHDSERLSHISEDMIQLDEEQFLDFIEEYKYRDEELDFIHSAIISDDYGTYIREIDEFHGISEKKKATTAVEILGLTDMDMIVVEEKLFGDEYKDVDLYEIFDFFEDVKKPFERGFPISKECTYLIGNENSLSQKERESIERDITSSNALIFEEDVEEIKYLLNRSSEQTVSEKVEIVDEIYDITDKVVILDDEEDIERFISNFPDGKQNNLKKLLKYLDGLFEKLPESTVKNFADSEYFDLYVKVMNDLDV